MDEASVQLRKLRKKEGGAMEETSKEKLQSELNFLKNLAFVNFYHTHLCLEAKGLITQ